MRFREKCLYGILVGVLAGLAIGPTHLGAQIVSHVRPIFDPNEFTDAGNVIKLAAAIGGDNITYNTTDQQIDWDGVQAALDETDQGVFNSIEFDSAFSIATDKACVGGTEPGTTCLIDANCDGGGTCTSGKQLVVGLSANVYQAGTEIASTDMPALAVLTNAVSTMQAGKGIDFGAGILELPQGTSSLLTTLGDVYFQTNHSPQPMVAMGDDTDALPIRACGLISFGPGEVASCAGGASTNYCYPGQCDSDATLQPAIAPSKMTISHLRCMTWYDMGASDGITWTLQTLADVSANCDAAADEGVSTCNTTGYTDTALACNFTGTTGTPHDEMFCNEASAAVTLSAGDGYRLKAAFTGTPAECQQTCTAVVCYDDL